MPFVAELGLYVCAARALYCLYLRLRNRPSPLAPPNLSHRPGSPATKATPRVPSQNVLSNGAGAVAAAPGFDGHGTGTPCDIARPNTSTASVALCRQPAAWSVEAGASGVLPLEHGAAPARLPCPPDEIWHKIARDTLIAEKRTVAAHARLSRICPMWACGLAGAHGRPVLQRADPAREPPRCSRYAVCGLQVW